MVTPGPTAVTYIGLPIGNGGGHKLGRLSVRAAHDATLAFLGTCTELTETPIYTFGVLDIPSLPVDTNAVAELEARFGGMAVPNDRAADALAFLQEIHPQPAADGLAAIWLSVRARFRVLDPATGSPLPGQDPARYGGKEFDFGASLGTSRLKLSLHNSASLAIDLSLPDLEDQELELVANWLEGHLPCKLSPKHWKRWSPTKTGSFVGRKIPRPKAP